jgi:hypothetical protein
MSSSVFASVPKRCLRGILLACILWLPLLAAPTAAQRFVVQEAGLDGGGGRVASGDLALTSSLAPMPVGTVQAGPYVLYSALPGPFASRAAIVIVHDPGTGGAPTAEGGQPRTLTARIATNNAPLRAARLFYRRGTDPTPTALSMTADSAGFVATIPGSAIGEAGLTYYFVAEDQDGVTIRAPREGVYSLPVRLAGDGPRKPTPQPGGRTQAAYRLLSIPVVLDDPRPEAVLGDDIPTFASASAYDASVARLFEPIGTRVAEFPGTGDFELGRAFWLIVQDEVTDIDVGAGTVGALTDPVQIGLSAGWNFVGTPFTVPVPVENLRTASGEAITLRAYGPNGYNSLDAPVTEMTPYEGYAVFVGTATTLTVHPPLQAGEVASAARTAKARGAAPPVAWRLRIRGTAGSGWDTDNVAAVHREASDGWDARDWPEPPALGGGLRIAFDAPSGAPTDVTLSADVRRPPTQGTTWPLTVHTDAAGPVTIVVDGIGQLPAGVEAWLLDLSTKTTWDLRGSNTARLAVLSDGAKRPMRLVVGTPRYVRDTLRDLDALPLTYTLTPPYPNPSVGPVAFQVGLPQADRVTIAVYNLLGQRLATLKNDEPMGVGFHTVTWDDARLASGMYFVRMRAGDYRATQKLVRVR